MGVFLKFMITEEGKVKVIPEHHRKKERLTEGKAMFCFKKDTLFKSTSCYLFSTLSHTDFE